MKSSIKSVLALALGIAFTGSQLFAGTATADIKVLTDKDWTEITERAELDAMLDIEEMPALELMNQNLSIDLLPGTFTTMELGAPLSENDEVGIVVHDANGKVIYQNEGEFKDIKTLRFRDYYDFDMTYMIKLYSPKKVYETKVQVAYR